MTHSISLVQEMPLSGSELNPEFRAGRPLVFVYQREGRYRDVALSTAQYVTSGSRVLVFEVPPLVNDNWKQLGVEFHQTLSDLKIRQLSVIGFGPACSLVQLLYLRDPRMVRTIVIVDGACNSEPTWRTRIIDAIEEALPLGLPLRSQGKAFNSRAHLQRIRAPSLVVTTSLADDFLKSQAHLMNSAMPSAWYEALEDPACEAQQLAHLVSDFQDVPAKCPQKNAPSRAA